MTDPKGQSSEIVKEVAKSLGSEILRFIHRGKMVGARPLWDGLFPLNSQPQNGYLLGFISAPDDEAQTKISLVHEIWQIFQSSVEITTKTPILDWLMDG